MVWRIIGICYSCLAKIHTECDGYIECQRCHQFVHDGTTDTTEPLGKHDDDAIISTAVAAAVSTSCDTVDPSSCCKGGHDDDYDGDDGAPTPVCRACSTTCGVCKEVICYHLWTDDFADANPFLDVGHFTCLRCDTPGNMHACIDI